MKAVLWKGPDSLAVEDVADLRPEPGEMLLEVKNCGICGSDLHAAKLGLTLVPDCIMGHEFSGVIAELGQGVTGWRVGERVAPLPLHSCGGCERCKAGEVTFCTRGARAIGWGDIPGAYAEYARVSPQDLVRLPENVSFRQGALVEPLAVGLHAVRQARMQAGAGVVVMGGGPIGQVCTLWAKREGAGCVVVSDPAEGRRKLAERLGADLVVDPGKQDPRSSLFDACGREPDVIFECVGVPGTINEAVQMAGIQGRVVVVGVCMEPDTLMPVIGIMKEVELKFVLAYTKGEFQEVVDALAGGGLNADAMITDVIGVEGVPDAFKALAIPNTQSKVMVEF
ncbi:MAG: alcohol dehydrogenase catalytic domain-containing protein [Deltaproteobacteria bacterium]|nr:alcohol dehydrogenase catalytic domain-containing protein [Deltaproteobacteria bacterium]